jgi:hypothetical protein
MFPGSTLLLRPHGIAPGLLASLQTRSAQEKARHSFATALDLRYTSACHGHDMHIASD